jgi:hypothetical protein
LRQWLAPKAIVTNKLNAIASLECVYDHRSPFRRVVAPSSFYNSACSRRFRTKVSCGSQYEGS